MLNIAESKIYLMKVFSFKTLFRSGIIRNSSIILGGNVLGQLITFLVYPILTRTYSEAEFGVFATFMSVSALLTTLATGRYEESLVVAKDRKETIHLLGFSFKLLIFFSFILFIGLALIRKPVFYFFKMESIEPFWLYLPFMVFFTGLTFLLNNLATRERQFKQIASAGLMQNSVNSAGKLIAGFSGLTRTGLIFSNLLSTIAGIFPYFSLKKTLSEALKGDWNDEQKAALRYIAFPSFNLGRNFLSGFSINLPFLVLIGIFGEASLGLYSLAFTLLNRPISIFSNSLFTTFFENAASTIREQKPLLPSLKKYWKYLCIYILPCFIIAFFIAKPIFIFLFGAQWEESAVYFQYLLPWMFMTMLASPVQFIPILFKKQRMLLILEIICLLFRWGALSIGIITVRFQTGILLFSIAGLLFSSLNFIWFYSLISKYEKHI
jgi:O-antigen/teichoic acid export membrane protein